MPTVDNPMDKLRALLAQINGAVESIPGCKIIQHGFNAPEDMDILQFAVRLDPEIVFAPKEPVVIIPDEMVTTDKDRFDAEQAAFNAQFDTLAADFKDDELDTATREIKEELREQLKSLRDDEGLGFDG